MYRRMNLKRPLPWMAIVLMICFIQSCDIEIRNIAEDPNMPNTPVTSGKVEPIDIHEKGFDLLDNMQGHWIGANRVIADDWDWFAFDYRPISASHIFGIFEGGSLGNLFTSFFVTDYKDTRTIMARNGGLLNGIYRTSYFVLDSVEYENNSSFYRLVDAEGGTNTMWMELRFVEDSLYFNAYTSGLGQRLPTRHMTFRAKKEHLQLADAAANDVGFPTRDMAWDFSDGFNQAHIQAADGAKSATFLAQDINKDVFQLAQESGDPWTIEEIPYLGYLHLDIKTHAEIDDANLLVYLSIDPLTDEFGYFTNLEAFNTILLFSDLIPEHDQFLISYLHPGSYYVNVTADLDGDGLPSTGDYTHAPIEITIEPGSFNNQLKIDDITVQN